jgi:hypothetical protein
MGVMQINFESKIALSRHQIQEMLNTLLVGCFVDVNTVNSPSADNGTTFTAQIIYTLPNGYILSRLFSLSLVLGQDCIAYFDSGSSGVAKGFVGLKPYAKFDDDLFIEFFSGKPLSEAEKTQNQGERRSPLQL